MNLLALSGGRHPYEESTPVLTRFLIDAGHTVTVTQDASILADAERMSGFDALVFNTLRAGEMTLNEDERAGMKSTSPPAPASCASTYPAASRTTGKSTAKSPAAAG